MRALPSTARGSASPKSTSSFAFQHPPQPLSSSDSATAAALPPHPQALLGLTAALAQPMTPPHFGSLSLQAP